MLGAHQRVIAVPSTLTAVRRFKAPNFDSESRGRHGSGLYARAAKARRGRGLLGRSLKRKAIRKAGSVDANGPGVVSEVPPWHALAIPTRMREGR
jgi:hypothetical protein